MCYSILDSILAMGFDFSHRGLVSESQISDCQGAATMVATRVEALRQDVM